MLDEFVPEIYDAGLEPDRWPHLLAKLSDQFNGATLYLCHESIKQFGIGDIWTHGFDTSVWSRMDDIYWLPDFNPAVASVIRAPLGVAFDRRQFFDDFTFERHPLARDIMLSQNLFHVVLSAVQRDAEVASAFWIARERQKPAIEGEELDRFSTLIPHIGRAMRVHRKLSRSESVARSFKSVLDGMLQGVMLLTGGLRIVYANPAAERILAACDGVRETRGTLRLASRAAHRRLKDRVVGLTHSMPSAADMALAAPRPSGAPAYVVTLAPAIGDAKSELAPSAQVIVWIVDPTSAIREPLPAWLTAYYQLTPAEAQTAILAVRALNKPEIATALGVSENTVKTHLKSVYDKLGVGSQAELVRAVVAGSPVGIQGAASGMQGAAS